MAPNCVVFLLLDSMLGRVAAFGLTGGVAATFLGLWFVLPWALKREG